MGTYSTNDGLQHFKCGSHENFELWRWLRGTTSVQMIASKSYNGTEGLNVWKPNILCWYILVVQVFMTFSLRVLHVSVMSMRIHVMFRSRVWPSLTTLNQHVTWINKQLGTTWPQSMQFEANQFDTWNWWIYLLFKQTCSKDSPRSYCWWFRNPKQPPGMLIKPCK